MARELREDSTGHFYSGRVEEDGRTLYASLLAARDCEAELAMLLMSAARSGALRLDRVLPFLTPATTASSTTNAAMQEGVKLMLEVERLTKQRDDLWMLLDNVRPRTHEL